MGEMTPSTVLSATIGLSVEAATISSGAAMVTIIWMVTTYFPVATTLSTEGLEMIPWKVMTATTFCMGMPTTTNLTALPATTSYMVMPATTPSDGEDDNDKLYGGNR